MTPLEFRDALDRAGIRIDIHGATVTSVWTEIDWPTVETLEAKARETTDPLIRRMLDQIATIRGPLASSREP